MVDNIEPCLFATNFDIRAAYVSKYQLVLNSGSTTSKCLIAMVVRRAGRREGRTKRRKKGRRGRKGEGKERKEGEVSAFSYDSYGKTALPPLESILLGRSVLSEVPKKAF